MSEVIVIDRLRPEDSGLDEPARFVEKYVKTLIVTKQVQVLVPLTETEVAQAVAKGIQFDWINLPVTGGDCGRYGQVVGVGVFPDDPFALAGPNERCQWDNATYRAVFNMQEIRKRNPGAELIQFNQIEGNIVKLD